MSSSSSVAESLGHGLEENNVVSSSLYDAWTRPFKHVDDDVDDGYSLPIKDDDDNFVESNRRHPLEGLAVREWSRLNAIRLEEKEMKEKELLNEIIDEAEEYKFEFHRRREVEVEIKKTINRKKEKAFLANQEKLRAEADKDYWKAIAEVIPDEVAATEKESEKKDQETTAIGVIQGPKPGKPTDLSRMHEILMKLKLNTPAHLKPSFQPLPDPENDSEASSSASPAPKVVPVA